jgi:hypothetical protein
MSRLRHFLNSLVIPKLSQTIEILKEFSPKNLTLPKLCVYGIMEEKKNQRRQSKRSTADQKALAEGTSRHGKQAGSVPGANLLPAGGDGPCRRCLNHGEHSGPAWPVGKEPDPILWQGRPGGCWTPCSDGGGGIGCFGTCGNLQETWGKSRLSPSGLARPARKGGKRPRCVYLEQFGFGCLRWQVGGAGE